MFADVFKQYGVAAVLGMVGDGYGPLETCHAEAALPVHCFRDQRNAAAAAIGYASLVNAPVALCLSPGPGLANAMMGLLELKSLKLPVIVVSLGIARGRSGTKAFQDADSLRMMQSVAKHVCRVENAESWNRCLHQACAAAIAPLQGISFLEIPDDVFHELQDSPSPADDAGYGWEPLGGRSISGPLAKQVADTLAASQRPLVIVGGGVRKAGCEPQLQDYVEACGAAVLTTAAGRGTLSEDHAAACGLTGLYLTAPAGELIEQADSVLFLGSAIEETSQIGVADWFADKHVIQVNHAAGEFQRLGASTTNILADVGDFLHALLNRRQTSPAHDTDREPWLQTIAEVKARQVEEAHRGRLSPIRQFLQALDRLDEDFVLNAENGLSDMWTYCFPLLKITAGRSFLSPGEQTGLGLAVGGVVGSKLCQPERFHLAIVGDGAFNMCVNALTDARELAAPVTIAVINNGGLSWPQVAQGDSPLGAKFSQPMQYERISHAYDCEYFLADDQADMDGILDRCVELNRNQNRTCVVEIRTAWRDDIFPGVTNNFL
ncbi:thiamine pyrophosphate-binding protein [Roseimaritima ulvae]|uniref:Acetolactate synthase large subunit n=1 Tax=Roseimaritima ulvae TaxID=980254 RepID=A0A5B9QWE4_9BACT|nr:thiamine pyrophosphate-binding protein [Roseimaritima ulvae]QEG42312.1 Acetolactate synthase large subunit [Roseimaritima ulvae]